MGSSGSADRWSEVVVWSRVAHGAPRPWKQLQREALLPRLPEEGSCARVFLTAASAEDTASGALGRLRRARGAGVSTSGLFVSDAALTGKRAQGSLLLGDSGGGRGSRRRALFGAGSLCTPICAEGLRGAALGCGSARPVRAALGRGAVGKLSQKCVFPV